ncbi:class D beta-lactamase [Oceanibaculum pacificum]|uniref:Class D beta-lactamase n=1 Tax=Oceanibaculum pacificum TaxID=580166 RepID=A0A154WFL4_9PROT|nr:class D beta-lactamase [Oceanibaculum pacificum]KZD12307.1 class D beta-lactamase [Oceanibaculum pacificum]
MLRYLLPAFLLLLAAPVHAQTASDTATCTVIADGETGDILFRAGPSCDKPVSPCSTFKVPLAVIGYDAGLLTSAKEPAIPYDPALNVSMEAWRQTTSPERWMRYSVVWYSQALTAELGMKRFQAYIDAFDYGNRDLSGDAGKDNGLTHAWLSSSLKISPVQQLDFLGRMLRHELPASARAQRLAAEIQPAFPLPGAPDGWAAYGKTGTGYREKADGTLDRSRQIGWFVGWAEKGERRLIFTRLLEDEGPRDGPASFAARDGLLADLATMLARETLK